MSVTFPKGGVHPQECKYSTGDATRQAILPDKVAVLLSQHIGAPAVACVQVGDKVKTGQLIASAGGFVSANIHSPISGTVTKIATVTDMAGYQKPAILIDREGDQWCEGIDCSEALSPYITSSREEIIKRITAAGIVGLGGATFPAHVKLAVPEGKKCEFLIINGAECEPYLTCDHRLMLEKSEEILVGVRILMKALDTSTAIIGIEENKPDAIERLTKLSAEYKGISVVKLKTKYPQGGEKQLIKALTGREVPNGKIPVDVGAVPFNVATVFAVYEAVQKNKPLIERSVTVTGLPGNKTVNTRVRIGTNLREVVESCGGVPENASKIIIGGPMMGKTTASLDIPSTKGSSGILFISSEDALRNEQSPCIRCAKCVSVCPMGLEPYLLAKLSQKKLFDKASQNLITSCIECGSCSFICPASRPLLDWIRMGKTTVIKLSKAAKK